MADKNGGYIGNSPSDSSVTIARQAYTSSGITTDFTFRSGYTPGYLDAYLNGVRLIESDDYVATDGTILSLTTAAQNGDTLELIAYKAFNVSEFTLEAEVPGSFNVSNNLIVGGNLDVDGHTELDDLNVSGVATVASAKISDLNSGRVVIAGTDGELEDSANLTFDGSNLSVGGNISVGGTLTYEDVTNIDSVGIITAQSGIHVTGGSVGIGTDNPNRLLTVKRTDSAGAYAEMGASQDGGIRGLQFRSADDGVYKGAIHTLDATSSGGMIALATGGAEKLRITSAGLVGIGTDNPSAKLEVSGDARVTGILTVGTSSVTINGNTGKVTGVSDTQLAAISSSVSGTATDVFVYDTSKDSDGGAWRKRTQNTSWYNETLGTATRGSRKEFPAVAVIVAESDKVTIYDGDDPDLPMWMVFNDGVGNNAADSTFLGTINAPISSILMLNGVLCVGFSSVGGWGVSEIGFVSDSQRWWWTSGIYKQTLNSIDKRNVGSGYYAVDTSDSVKPINAVVNDVAMTVLPNAPIDDTTGLPIPTIAVATAGAVSVIKDDGNVYDLNIVNRPYSSVDFTSDNLIFAVENPSGVDYDLMRYFKIPSADRDNSNAPNTYGPSSLPALFPTNTKGNIFDSFAYGSPVGLSIIDHANGTAPTTSGMIAYVASEYNTGWMQGDIKGAFLSDTDTTNVTGSELVTNGTFDSNTTGWTAGNSATLSIVSNVLRITYNGSANPYAVQEISGLTVGKIYVASVDIVNISAGEDARMIVGTTATASVPTSGNFTTTGAITVTFTAESTSHWVKLQSLSNATGEYAEFDNISVKIAEEDRSVNNNGLQVNGTVTKSAVATGAELVAYSGFSASNHLRQPPNSDMNIGTGDAYEMIWFKTTTGSGTQMIMSYEGGANGTSDYGKPFNIRFHNGTVGGWASHNNFSTYDNIYDTTSTADGAWHCAAWVRRGAVFELYVDGRFAGSDTGAVGSNALSDANSELVIGGRKRGHAPGTCEEPFPGSLALARIGKSAPSAEQIKKIYEDEKCLFHENAKATLYGSSDAVTALAFDEATNLLHVGTSAGRSDFSGLRRINNTTTAVTTAISAHDGSIAQQ